MIPDYTIVIGVDVAHIDHLAQIFPNWLERKPSTFLNHPLIVFYDTAIDTKSDGYFKIYSAVARHPRVTFVPWPPPEAVYEDDLEAGRFGKSQRYRMLSGFVHVPAFAVKTPYWLKIDLDVVAIGNDDWIEEDWFDGEAVIVASSWGYSKPANTVIKLDEWVFNNAEALPGIASDNPLNIRPRPGSNLVKHKRIISWCAFFHTGFTRFCSEMAQHTCGYGKLPIPSQDGFLWYCAHRCELYYRTVPMKNYGWAHCAGYSQAKAKIESLKG